MTTNHSITGRDGYIVAKALYWALKFSQSQPEGIREVSDEEDMKAILTERYPQFAKGFRLEGEFVLGILRDAEIHGDDLDADHDMQVAFSTPPDLSPSPSFVFITDGSDPTPEPDFTEEDGNPSDIDVIAVSEKSENLIAALFPRDEKG